MFQKLFKKIKCMISWGLHYKYTIGQLMIITRKKNRTRDRIRIRGSRWVFERVVKGLLTKRRQSIRSWCREGGGYRSWKIRSLFFTDVFSRGGGSNIGSWGGEEIRNVGSLKIEEKVYVTGELIDLREAGRLLDNAEDLPHSCDHFKRWPVPVATHCSPAPPSSSDVGQELQESSKQGEYGRDDGS